MTGTSGQEVAISWFRFVCLLWAVCFGCWAQSRCDILYFRWRFKGPHWDRRSIARHVWFQGYVKLYNVLHAALRNRCLDCWLPSFAYLAGYRGFDCWAFDVHIRTEIEWLIPCILYDFIPKSQMTSICVLDVSIWKWDVSFWNFYPFFSYHKNAPDCRKVHVDTSWTHWSMIKRLFAMFHWRGFWGRLENLMGIQLTEQFSLCARLLLCMSGTDTRDRGRRSQVALGS